MRLLVVTNDFPPTVGGIENYVYSLVRRWTPSDVVVVTRAVPGDREFDLAQQFRVVRHEAQILIPTRELSSSLARLVAEESIDAVHFPSCLPLGHLGVGLGKPYALSVHGGEFRLSSRLPGIRTVLKRVCRNSSVILPESSFAARIVRELMGEKRPLRTITCGVDVERYGKFVAPAVPVASKGPVIVSVSRLIPRKGPRTLIECLPIVKHRHPDAHLLIVGGGSDLGHLEQMAAGYGVSQSITFAGPQPWDRIPSYLSAGEIFALPTRPRFLGTETEGLPLVYVEAAAAGLPLIGGDSGGVGDAVRDGETGYLVDGSDPQCTAAAIVRLLDDPELAGRMGRAARKMVEEEFTWDAIAAAYRDALHEFCK